MITGKIDGVEREINNIEPILREIDEIAARIFALMPNFDGRNFEAVLPRIPQLEALHGPLVERILIAQKWNEQGHCNFALDMWLCAKDWQEKRS